MSSGARTKRPQGAAWEAVKGIPNITYRRFDHWCTKGYIRYDIERGKSEQSGNWRTISEAEVAVVALMVELVVALGFRPDAAEIMARRITADGMVTLGNLQIGKAS